jgi:hypothetical protein
MDAFEGPLGGWLLQANQKADAETALTFLDSMCRRFLREAAAAEAGKLSVRAEFPASEYWRAKEAGQGEDRALDAGNGEVRSVGGSSRNKAGSADRSLRAIALPRGPTVSNPDLNGRKEESDGLRGTSDGCDGRNAGSDGWDGDRDGRGRDSDGRNRLSDGPNGSSDGQEVTSEGPNRVSNRRNRELSGQSGDSDGQICDPDGLDGPPTMDPIVLRLLRWVVRQPALEPAVLAAALMPIEIECARVPSARVIAARNGALALGKRVVESDLKPGPAQRSLLHQAWGMLDALLPEDHGRPGESAKVRGLARELGVAECAAGLLGAGPDSRISELHLLNVLEACTGDGFDGGLQTKPGFIKRTVGRLKYALSVYARARDEGWDEESPPDPLGRPGVNPAGLLPAPGVPMADDLRLEWNVSATCLDPPPVWPRVFRAVYQLLKVLADVIREQGEPAFVAFVRSGGVEAAAVFIGLNPTRLLIVQSADPNVWETDWGLRARKRLAGAAALADGLWERAEVKYGLRRCGRVKVGGAFCRAGF